MRYLVNINGRQYEVEVRKLEDGAGMPPSGYDRMGTAVFGQPGAPVYGQPMQSVQPGYGQPAIPVYNQQPAYGGAPAYGAGGYSQPAAPMAVPASMAAASVPMQPASNQTGAATAQAAPQASTLPSAAETNVESPMPGNVFKILVSVGQQVNAGDVLMILEAMKMENEIVAPVSGRVKQILAAQGSAVDTSDILLVLS